MLKKLFATALLISTALVLNSCDSADNPLSSTKGKVFVTSTPDSALILVNGVSQSKFTPDTVQLDPGTYQITLRRSAYRDTTITVSVVANQTTVPARVTLTASSFQINSTPAGARVILNGANTGLVTPANVTLLPGTNTIRLEAESRYDSTFTIVGASAVSPVNITLRSSLTQRTSVRIYESATTASVPSGLILVSGRASTIGSGSGRDSVDVFYRSGTFTIASASLFSSSLRESFLKVGTSNNLNDGVATTVKDPSWTTSGVADTQVNYFFIYTQNGNYAKARITGSGGGVGLDPAWVEITYWYNGEVGDLGFQP